MYFLLDDPYKFFKKNKPRFRLNLIYAIIISAIFSIMNQVSIYLNFTRVSLVNGHIETAAIIFFSILAGFFLVSGLFSIISYHKLNKQCYKSAFFILVYSSTPFMLFGWIPHAAIKIALLVWAFVFLSIGIHIQMKMKYNKSIAITFILLLIIAILSLTSQNFILAPV